MLMKPISWFALTTQQLTMRVVARIGMVAVACSAICGALREGPRQLITNAVVTLDDRVFVPRKSAWTASTRLAFLSTLPLQSYDDSKHEWTDVDG
jgi:hypothetical protein